MHTQHIRILTMIMIVNQSEESISRKVELHSAKLIIVSGGSKERSGEKNLITMGMTTV